VKPIIKNCGDGAALNVAVNESDARYMHKKDNHEDLKIIYIQ
jgi:hypothetical protein